MKNILTFCLKSSLKYIEQSCHPSAVIPMAVAQSQAQPSQEESGDRIFLCVQEEITMCSTLVTKYVKTAHIVSKKSMLVHLCKVVQCFDIKYNYLQVVILVYIMLMYKT